MNRHFEDARYYLKRAAETTGAGVAEELEPLRERVRALAGRDAEPEPSRFEAAREDVRDLRGKAEGEARSAVAEARERVSAYRAAE